MKKLSILLMAIYLFISCSNEKTFQISGKLTDFGNPDGTTMLYLKTKTVDEVLINLDSTLVAADGAFVLKGKSKETDLYFLADRDNVFGIPVFVDPANKVTVYGSARDYQNIKIEGSETQKLYDEFLASIAPIQAQQNQIEQSYYAYSQDASISKDQLESIEDELVVAYEKLNDDIDLATEDFIKAHANTPVAAYLVYKNANQLTTSAEIEEQLQWLDPALNHKFMTLAKALLERVKLTEEGSVLPNIELPDAEGKMVSLESLRGKYVLVDFWATWCGPCMMELPNVQNAYQKYHDKGLEVYSISLDHDKDAWIEGIKTYEISWICVKDLEGSPTAKQMAIKYIPTTFLLNPDGVIVAVNLRGEELENKLAELMP